MLVLSKKLIVLFVFNCFLIGESKRNCFGISIVSICNDIDDDPKFVSKTENNLEPVSKPKPKSLQKDEGFRNILGEVLFKPIVTAILNATTREQLRVRRKNNNYKGKYNRHNQQFSKRLIVEPEVDYCKSGDHQSPIDIKTKQTRVNISLYIKLTGYHEVIKGVVVKNTGHSGMPRNVAPTISGPALDNKSYKLHDIHFHWSTVDRDGSEHSINGRKYPVEVHFVHYDVNRRSFEEAHYFKDGIVVLTSFFQVTENPNKMLDPIIESIRRVPSYNQITELPESLDLLQIISSDLKIFFKYRGSLTRAPCSEVVTWIIFPKPVQIGFNQLNAFKTFKFNSRHDDKTNGNLIAQGHHSQSNGRQLQKVNGRDIVASYIPANFI